MYCKIRLAAGLALAVGLLIPQAALGAGVGSFGPTGSMGTARYAAATVVRNVAGQGAIKKCKKKKHKHSAESAKKKCKKKKCKKKKCKHRLAAVGDICTGSCTGQGSASAATVRGINPERLLGLGDFQYQNAGTNGSTFIAGWQSVWGDLASRTVPVFGATHDTCDGAGIWECYPVSYFNTNGAPEAQGKLSDHQWGYSFDIGAWHVVGFNYDTTLGGSVAQVTADLDAHPSQCLLAFVHAPIWGSPSSEHPTDQSSAWAQTLINHGVDLVLNGHQHFYERNIVGSTTSITEGEGGIGHYSRTSVAPTAVAYNDTSFGVLKLTLGASSWDTRFIANAGAPTFTDTASGTCGARKGSSSAADAPDLRAATGL